MADVIRLCSDVNSKREADDHAISKLESCGFNRDERDSAKSRLCRARDSRLVKSRMKRKASPSHIPSIKSVTRSSYLFFAIKHWMHQRPNPDPLGLRTSRALLHGNLSKFV